MGATAVAVNLMKSLRVLTRESSGWVECARSSVREGVIRAGAHSEPAEEECQNRKGDSAHEGPAAANASAGEEAGHGWQPIV